MCVCMCITVARLHFGLRYVRNPTFDVLVCQPCLLLLSFGILLVISSGLVKPYWAVRLLIGTSKVGLGSYR